MDGLILQVMHIAAAMEINSRLIPKMKHLQASLHSKVEVIFCSSETLFCLLAEGSFFFFDDMVHAVYLLFLCTKITAPYYAATITFKKKLKHPVEDCLL